MTELPQSPADPFLDWLNTGTTRRASATMFGDQAALAEVKPIWAEIEKLTKQLDGADDGGPTVQRALGEKLPSHGIRADIADLEAKAEPLEARIERSRSVWNLRALRHDEIEAIEADHPLPFMPTPTEEQSTTDKGKARFVEISRKWQADTKAVHRARTLAQISRAIESVETPTGTVASISVEQLESMLGGNFGRARIDLLDKTLSDLMTIEEAPTRPFSSSDSGSTRE